MIPDELLENLTRIHFTKRSIRMFDGNGPMVAVNAALKILDAQLRAHKAQDGPELPPEVVATMLMTLVLGVAEVDPEFAHKFLESAWAQEEVTHDTIRAGRMIGKVYAAEFLGVKNDPEEHVELGEEWTRWLR